MPTKLHVPAIRTAKLSLLAASAPVLILTALAALGFLDWIIAVAAMLACLAASTLLARFCLTEVYAARRLSERLARETAEESTADRIRTLIFTELSESSDLLLQAWARKHRELGTRAELAEAIFEGLPEPLILINDDRQIVRATSGATALLGDISLERDLSSVMRNPEVLQAADRVLANGASEFVEFENSFPAAKTLNVSLKRLPTSRTDGLLVLLSLSDVSEFKQVQQVRTDFVANVSHELKTPLSVVSSCVKTLQGSARDDPEARRKFTEMMDNHITRMVVLIEDLLSLSRIELNESTQPTKSVSMHALLANVAGELQVPAQRRGIEIRIERHAELDTIPGDGNEISQLFRNLVENAVRYGREDSVVRIVTKLVEMAGQESAAAKPVGIEIEIIDRGLGIAAHHLPRLTERFYRVDAARSREVGGTGLGLAIVKHIVSRHRGRLLIESVENEGSSFTVQLPLSEHESLAELAPRHGRVIVT